MAEKPMRQPQILCQDQVFAQTKKAAPTRQARPVHREEVTQPGLSDPIDELTLA